MANLDTRAEIIQVILDQFIIFDPVSFNEKKISQTLIVPGLKINAVLCENILEEATKSQIDVNSFCC